MAFGHRPPQHGSPPALARRVRSGSNISPHNQAVFDLQRRKPRPERPTPGKAFAEREKTITTRLALTFEARKDQEARDKAYLGAPGEDVQIAAEVRET
jgi:hypothetical protein